MTHRDKPAIAREMLARRFRDCRMAVTPGLVESGQWDDSPEILAIIEALETRLPMPEEEIEARVRLAADAVMAIPTVATLDAVERALRNIHLPLPTDDRESECPSCGGLNLSCPEGCGRDPKTGELNGTTLDRESDRGALLPCPFCGGEPHRPEFVCESGSKDIWTVRCLPCDYDLEGPRETSSKADAAAVERWNTRPSSASQGG